MPVYAPYLSYFRQPKAGRLLRAPRWSNNHSGTIDGAWGSAASLAVAALANDAPSTLLVVVPNPTDVAPWVEDIATFTGLRPVVFESWETWPVVSNKGKLDPTTTSRLRLLQSLLQDAPKVVVLRRRGVPTGARTRRPRRTWTQHQHRRHRRAERTGGMACGERLRAARRCGGMIRASSAGAAASAISSHQIRPDPVRLEFFGDEIESIRTFAAGSQRSLETKKNVVLLNVEVNEDTKDAHRFRVRCPHGLPPC